MNPLPFFKTTLSIPELQKFREQVAADLKKATESNPDYALQWKHAIGKGAKKLKPSNYWRFRLLHSQFSGAGVLGLPVMVRAARFVVKKIGKEPK